MGQSIKTVAIGNGRIDIDNRGTFPLIYQVKVGVTVYAVTRCKEIAETVAFMIGQERLRRTEEANAGDNAEKAASDSDRE